MPNRPKIPAEIAREILVESGHRCAVCGTPCPLEKAHIIPWKKTKDHSVKNLICLCANCHNRADIEKWGAKTLKKYKEKPWIMKNFEKAGDIITSKTTFEIDMEEKSLSERQKRWLQYALAAFLEIPPDSVRF
ncbi:hypothetical protein CEE37_11785 [candidate division LCP-89 bacterium B3_LCP]|uniref:HNH nuclease domain-containing protein n=1 Tax=candidate division LCP-89 bacterium B3_LCP TaxID=2012998 RepID=A0A532UVY0_UNCL8|nr:MAG: hypothetical protein CEE37_11785 [candidate division LCP-89 bacterium B3_LCP]